MKSLSVDLKELILKYYNEKYVSESSKNKIKTGNKYQSICLLDQEICGFRKMRGDFLEAVNFENKTVLDLGSNLGEISRYTRSRGAAVVDGYEFDHFFIKIAQLINVFNDVTRVSFFQKDITDRKSYAERYDIVLACSVFEYIQDILDVIYETTRDIFILETHATTISALRDLYLKKILIHFDFYHFIGESDWGESTDKSKGRYFIYFTKNDNSIQPVKFRGGSKLQQTAECLVDLTKTNFSYIDTFLEKYNNHLPLNSDCCQSFFETIKRHHCPEEDGLDFSKGLSGLVYWEFFLLGFSDFLKLRRVDEHNVYCTHLKKVTTELSMDADLADAISDTERLIRRVEARFLDLKLALFGHDELINPIYLYSGSERNRFNILLDGQEIPLAVSHIDGYHRIFSLKICGVLRAAGEIIKE